MVYGSVCSGIEAATVAWEPLGWRASFFAEIDKFPSAVLSHHYPHTPNVGDFTQIEAKDHEPIDLLVGGTPCQSFSVAGLRGGLADDRGNLALEFLKLAQRTRPRWLVWENVPGVLSSGGGRDFGAILGGMVELRYGFAYRVLDAQYVRVDGFGRAVPQRRRRVFVVGYIGDARRAAAVLFERAGLLGHSSPRREAGQGLAQDVVSSLTASGRGVGRARETRGQDPVVAVAFGGNNSAGPIDVSTACNAHGGGGRRMDFESETFVAHPLRGEGHDGSEDGTGRGTPIVPVAFDCKGTEVQCVDDDGSHPTLRSMGHAAIAFDTPQITSRANRSSPTPGGPCHPLAAGAHPPAIATQWAVRRLTPRECERLQGFPDGYTDVPWRGKTQAPDGSRYKALGNSMAVNVMRWIGRRIEMVETIVG